MSLYDGLLFFYVLILLMIPVVVLGLMEKKLKWYGFFVTLVFTVCIFFTSREMLFFIIGFSLLETVLVWAMLKVKNHCSEKITKIAVWIFTALSLIPLLMSKAGSLIHMPLAFLGVSYMTFRGVQMILEIYDGLITKVNYLEFLYFLLYFPSVSSGPIDRFRRFQKDLDTPLSREEYLKCVSEGVHRLFSGALYYFVFSVLIYQKIMVRLPDTLLGNWGYMYAYTIFLFFNFAGYSKMAIGTGYLFGIRVPENFNMPFLSKDMKDFWSRWHISLSTWFRDYLYTRFVRVALIKKWFKDRHTGSYIGYSINMVVMGLWHGLQPHYLIYGIYHAALMCGNDILDTRWKKFKKIKKDPKWEWVCAFVTFHLVCFGLLIFSGRLN